MEDAYLEQIVEHAGLVLIAPFFEPFFKAIGVYEGSANIDQANYDLCVHALQYLATGETHQAENELLLAKYLCDVPVSFPIDRFFELPEYVKNEADELLLSVIEHWAALKNTSPLGLRQMFFSRKAKLDQSAKVHKLSINRLAQDVLLDRIPWSYGMLSLPWKKTLLQIDW